MAIAKQRLIATWVFGSLAFVLLATLIFIDYPREREPLVRFFTSLCAGLFGYFLSGSLRVVSRGALPWLGRVVIQSTGGTALFLIVWFSWPTVSEATSAASLGKLNLLIERKALNQTILYRLVDRGLQVAPVPQIAAVSPDDKWRIEATLDKPAYCGLLEVDPDGKVAILATSESPVETFLFPGPKQGAKLQFDQPGWQALVLVVSPTSIARRSQTWLKQLAAIGPPPNPPANQPVDALLAVEEIVDMQDHSYTSFANTVFATVSSGPAEATLIMFPVSKNAN